MLSSDQIMQLIASLIWLLAGVGVFIVGMNFMGDALEKSASSGMKRLLEKISNNRFSGVGIGAGVTAIIQSSSATSVMVIGLVNAGVMTLMQATPIIMGANIGTTVTGILVALKNDYFNMLMYTLAFAGVMMGFAKKEKVKLAGLLCSGLGLIFVGLNIMSSEEAFGNPLVENMFTSIFEVIDFPLLLILVGAIFTALIQSSSAATGVVITMVGAGVLPLDLALFIVLGANIGTCVTALLASIGANANSKRVALIHFTFNVIGTAFFTAIIWIFKDPVVNFLVSVFPGDDPMSLQMRVSLFHVVFNVTTTLLLLPFVKQLVNYSCAVIKDKKEDDELLDSIFIDERLLSTPTIALDNCFVVATDMAHWAQQSFDDSAKALFNYSESLDKSIREAEKMTDRYEDKLGSYLVKLSSSSISEKDSAQASMLLKVIGDFERISDHARNIMLSGAELSAKKLSFTNEAKSEIAVLSNAVSEIVDLSFYSFTNNDASLAVKVESLEEVIDGLKEKMRTNHTKRLQKGNCSLDTGFVWSDLLTNFERISDHCSNIVGAVVDFEHNDLNTHKALRKIRRSGQEYDDQYKEYSEKYQLA
ncbi:MAG: Na/Pi cotransporter family protein [Ruminococcus sp.]|nr:Na/Pi cotransporter family protein [Ruminococcus sp.]